MKYFSKRYRLVLILSFLVVFLASIKYFYKVDWSKQNNPIQVSPTPTLAPVSIEISNLIKDYPLNNVLPYYGVNFDIKNYSAPLTLVVKIKSTNQEEITKEMTELFEKEKIDLDSHHFEWSSFTETTNQ